jgi:hypothetical protein
MSTIPCYARLRAGTPARTVSVSDDVMADADGAGLVLGIEALDGSDWRDALVTLAMQGRLRLVTGQRA